MKMNICGLETGTKWVFLNTKCLYELD